MLTQPDKGKPMISNTWSLNRREFAQGSAALFLGASTLALRLSALDPSARVAGEFTTDFSTSFIPFNRMLFGQFLEHFHRQVYGGGFDPGSRLAGKHGFRPAVI